MKMARNLAFCLLICAGVYAKTAPVKGLGEGCVTNQPFCCDILEIDGAAAQCGLGNYYFEGCCTNCGWDGDQCCAAWTCIG